MYQLTDRKAGQTDADIKNADEQLDELIRKRTKRKILQTYTRTIKN